MYIDRFRSILHGPVAEFHEKVWSNKRAMVINRSIDCPSRDTNKDKTVKQTACTLPAVMRRFKERTCTLIPIAELSMVS